MELCDQRELVKERWRAYKRERLEECLKEITKIKYDLLRPAQALYFKAQILADLDVDFHVDENTTLPILNALFRVDTTDEVPAIKKRYFPFTEIEKAFLESKCRSPEKRDS